MAELTERARVAEAAGFRGLALMDHLAPPRAEGHDMVDAMVAASWLAASTDSLVISHLVLCDGFREPSVLARQATSLDQASGGRFELGIGWGSVPDEFATFGIDQAGGGARRRRLAESLEVMRALWTGEPVDFAGEFHTLRGAQQQPTPTRPIPVVIGGSGPKTMALVAEHADWWNCPMYGLDRLAELRALAGWARPSVQQMVTFVPDTADAAERDTIEAKANQRFGWAGDAALAAGSAPELIDHFGELEAAGIERVYVWFTDFAPTETINAFGKSVISTF